MSPKHNILKNKLKLIIFSLIMLCSIIPVMIASLIKVDAATSWLEENKVSISASLDGQEDVINNAEGNVTVYIATKLSKTSGENYSAIRVPAHVRTKNYTALSNRSGYNGTIEYYDYEKVNEVVYLSNRNGDIIYQTITIRVNPNEYMINDETLSFYVEIVDVLSEHFSINNNHKQIKVNIKANHSYTTKEINGYQMLNEYSYNLTHYITEGNNRWDTGEIIDKSGQTFTKDFDLFNSEVKNDPLVKAYKEKFSKMADLYVGNQAYLCESAYHLSSYFDIKIYSSDYNNLLYKGSYRGMDNDNGNLAVFGMYVSNAEQKDIWYPSSPTAFIDLTGDYRERNVYLRASDGIIKIEYTNNSDYFRRIHDWQLCWVMVDNKAPEVTYVGYNQDAYKANDVIDIALKFNEPVQVRGSLDKVKIKATTKGTGDFNNKEIELVCTKAGNSNTVIFSYDPKEYTGSISEINMTGFVNGSNIVDYGRNTTDSNNSFDASILKITDQDKNLKNINFNNTNPSFVLDNENQEDIDNGNIKKTHTATITMPVNDELYGLYYVWTKDAGIDYDLSKRYEFVNSIDSDENIELRLQTLPENLRNLYYEYKELGIGFISKNDFKANGSKLQTTLENETGDYYLHVLGKTIYDNKDTYKRFGPFKIDNESPSIDNIVIGSALNPKEIGFDISDYSLSIENNELKNIANIIVYAKESPLNDLTGAKRILIYGNADALDYDIDGRTSVNLSIFEENGKYKVRFKLDCDVHLGFNLAKESGLYYLGFSATDSLGNKLELKTYDRTVLFDKRDLLEAEIYYGENKLTDDIINDCYIIDLSESDTLKNIYIKTKKESMTGYNYKIYSINSYDGYNSDPVNFADYFESYEIGNESDTLSFKIRDDVNACGYYEIITHIENISNTSDSKYARTIRLYIVDSTKETKTANYKNIYEGNNVIKYEAFCFDVEKYYYMNGYPGSIESEYYNTTNNGNPLYFYRSTYLSNYITAREYQDLYPVLVTSGNKDYITNNKATEDAGYEVKEGQIWIRYKASDWSFDNKKWVYYRYDGNTTNTAIPASIDVNALSYDSSLKNAVYSVASTIDNASSSTSIQFVGLDSHGSPYLSKDQIPNTHDYNTLKTGQSTTLSNNVYKLDDFIYQDEVTVDDVKIRLATWYNFTYYPCTNIFYSLKGENDFKRFTGSNLGSIIGESGVYTIKEYDSAGLRIYDIYIDKTAPVLSVSYTDIKGNVVETTFNEINNGDFIHAKNFTITKNGYKADIDRGSYIKFTDILTNKVTRGDANFNLYDDEIENDKIVEIFVSDLSGNHYTFKVSVTDKELEADVNVIPNDQIIVTIKDRDIKTISSFIVNYNDVERDGILKQAEGDCINDNALDKLNQEGVYEFKITDLFGYTIKPKVTLIREKTTENDDLIWYNKIGNSFEEVTDIETIDGVNFYVRSDKQLYLKLDADILEPSEDILDRPNAIYRYETTGNVTVHRVELEDGIYLETSSALLEKWSLKLWYIDFPDNYVEYSRIDEKGVSWLNDNEVSISASMLEYDGDVEITSDRQLKLYVVTKTPYIKGTTNDTLSDLNLGVHVRTESYSAVAGIDYDAIDETIYLTNKNYDVIYQPIYINVRQINWAMDGNAAYFYVEIADVLAEGFKINENQQKVKVILDAKLKLTSKSAFNTSMVSEYLTAVRDDTSWYTGLIEDMAGQTRHTSFNFKNYTSNTAKRFNEIIDNRLAVLYSESDTKADEKWVSLSSTFDIAFYDKDSKGTQLFSGSYNKLNESQIYFGVEISGGNAIEINPKFADSPNSFKDTSETYDRTKGYYVRIPSRQLYVTYLNNSNYFRKLYSWYNTFIIIDETAPTLTGWYIDNGNYKKGQKLNVVVTFSEPVHINGNVSDVKLQALLKGSGSYADKNVEFVCEGNLGLDRLIFSYDPAGELETNGNIDNIVITGFTNSNKVSDYGRNINNQNNTLIDLKNEAELKKNRLSPSDLGSDLTVRYDSNMPNMTILTGIDAEYKSSYEVEISIQGREVADAFYYISQDATIDFDLAQRYGLLTSIADGDLKPLSEKLNNFTDDFKTIYNSIKDQDIWYVSGDELYNNGNKLTVNIDGLTGDYYLHVLVKSYYDNTSNAKNAYGKFKLSNAAPEISNIVEADSNSDSRTINFNISDYMISRVNSTTVSGLSSIILYVSEYPLSDINRARKILLYGTTTLDDVEVYTGDKSLDVGFDEVSETIVGGHFKLDAAKHLFKENQESGTYYIGISATNSLGNTSLIFEPLNAIAFDTRSEFGVIVKEGSTVLSDDVIKNAYVIDVSTGNKTIKLENNFNSAFDTYNISHFNGTIITDSNLEVVTSVFTDYLVSTTNTITFTAKEENVGYYEIRTSLIKNGDGGFIKLSGTIRLYIINGSDTSITKNYEAIYKSNGNIIVPEVFSLNSLSFYYRDGQVMGAGTRSYYNNADKPLLFSTKEKAREYVKAMEYLDMYPVIFTAQDILNYQNGNIRIDTTETHKPQVGDVWIRYKSSGWRFSTAQNDWLYYYYRDKSTGTTLDVTDTATIHRLKDLAPNLYYAIDDVVTTILSKGSMIALTSLNDSLDSHGVLSVDSNRIPLTQSFTTTKNGTTLLNNNYTFDTDVYHDAALDSNINIATWYKFEYSSMTKIFFKEEGTTDNFVSFRGSYLADVVEKSGKYRIREYDNNGMREYVVYVDKTAPTIVVTYQAINGSVNHNIWLKEDVEGTFFHTNSFKIIGLYDKEANDDFDTYKANPTVDKYANVAIIDLTTGEEVLKDFGSINNNFTGATPDGITLDEGVYEIIVTDRSGNKFSFRVSVISEEKALKADITVIPNDRVIVSIPYRDKATISSFVYNNRTTDRSVDFNVAATLVDDVYQVSFIEAGFYGFTITDLYGYTIRPNEDTGLNCATLTRVNISESDDISWLTRKDDGSYAIIDKKSVDRAGGNVIYIKSDDKLTLRLDSTDIYSYDFTGNVKVIERTVVENNKTYLYLDTTSSERWSVRLYYTDFPDNFVTYNRVAAVSVVPSVIDLYSDNTNSAGIVQPDSNNNIIVYVQADPQNPLSSEVKVTVRTKNRSAIAELGDYEAYTATVTLTPEQPKAKVVILTHPSGYATYDNGILTTRTFDVVIDKIEGNGEAGKNEIECAVAPEFEFFVVEKNGIKVFDPYLKGESTLLDNIVTNTAYFSEDEGKYYDVSQILKLNPIWVSNYLNTGLSNIYVTSKFDIADNHGLGGKQGNAKISLIDSTTGTSMFYINLDKIGNDNKSIALGSNYAGVASNNETYDQKTSVSLKEARGNAIAGRYFIVPTNSDGNIKFNLYQMTAPLSSDGNDEVNVIILALDGIRYELVGRIISNLYAYSTLIDSSRPTVVGWYLDDKPLKVGEKMRLCVRFSEPVYINGTEPSISARSATSASYLEFKYKGGAGTDTLYFEYDPEKDVNDVVITDIILDSFSHQASIVDYAYNASKENNRLDTTELPKEAQKCNLDSRVPSISMSNDIKTIPVKNETANLTLSKVSLGATLYYSWTLDSEPPVDYANKKTLTATDLTGVNIEGNGMSGVYYLHVMVESAYGKTQTQTYGPFYFDNQPPAISNLEVEDATKALSKRTISFNINELPKGSAGSEIDSIYLYYGVHGANDNKVLTLYNKDSSNNYFEIAQNGRVSFVLNATDLGMPSETQGYYDLGLYAEDTLGNIHSVANYVFSKDTVNFDNRSSIDIRVDTTSTPIFRALEEDVFDSNNDVQFRFTFSYLADEYKINEFYLGNTLIPEENYDNFFTVVNEADGITLTVKKGLVGHIKLNLLATSGSEGSQAQRTSRDFGFYMSNGFETSVTNNYNTVKNSTLLINKVYFLGTYAFYYHDGTSIRQLNYNDTSLFQAFSSKDKAKEYLRYYELLDLGAMRITTSAIADSLNSGDGSYRKASQDASVRADVDQVWIRYKRSTWSESTSPDSWVYYYYGSSLDIDLDNLPVSLTQAIDQVVDTIVSKGRYEYLTTYNEGLNKYNSPSLNAKQINPTRLSTSSSMANTSYRSANIYVGDSDIFNSQVTPTGFDTCSLATTYQFVYSEYTKLFYVKADGSGIINDDELRVLPEGTVFGELDLAEGVYWIREVDEFGARDYQVYIDKTAPHVVIEFVNAKDEETRMEIDSSVNGITYGWKALKILSITNEIDDMAYVAVYKKNGVLVDVYRKDEIPTDGVELPEGVYYFEILDRSGNMYKINVALTDSPLDVRVVTENNRFVRVDCNREDNQIVSYEIYLNDQLLESNYQQTATYYQAGSYRIYVRDSYSFEFSTDVELRRDLPAVSWYYNDQGTYVQYDGSQEFIKMSKTADKEYQITTNRLLTFMFDDSAGYVYEFNQKNISSQSNYSGKIRVTLNSEIDWTLVVRYERYPEIAVTYRCTFDNTAPIINVDASQDRVSYNDQLEIAAVNSSISKDSPEYFTPTDIFFTLTDSSNVAVRDGQTVYSNLLKARFSDKSVCTEVYVYLNDTLIGEYKESSGVKDITLSRLGIYRIVAKDALGNESVFSFNNEETISFAYVVDDEIIALKKNPSTLITDNNYPTDAYGHKYASFNYNGSATIVFLIVKGEESRYLRYRMLDGGLYQIEYIKEVVKDEAGNNVLDVNGNITYRYVESANNLIKNVNVEAPGSSFRIAERSNSLANIYLKLDDEMNISYYVEANNDDEITVYSRLNYAEINEPYFAKTVLCGSVPTVTLEHTNPDAKTKEITPESIERLVNLNGEFRVKNIDFKANKIKSVMISYSETAEFTDYVVVYDKENGYQDIRFSEDGLYSLIVENEYGYVADYTLILSSHFRVITKAIYEDDVTNQYSTKTTDVIKANEEIEIDIYSTFVKYKVTYNDIEEDEKSLTNDNGICTLSFDKEGKYSILIIDGFENEVTVNFEINRESEISFDHNYLTGYNEKALRYDEGYTNKRLSINKDLLLSDGIKEISMIYEDETYVIFNLLVENPKEISEEDLTEVVGKYGDGIYTIFIRNEYGETVTYDIHYRETSPLTLTRQIKTSTVEELIDVTDGVNQVFSNFIVRLSTEATRFELKVDGATKDMPLELRFPTDGDTDEGEYIYNVTYLDEYGFEYSIEVNLIRKKLDINLDKHMKVEVIDDVNMTKNDVQIDFDKTLKCEYTLNGGERQPYQSGQVLNKDGAYRFYLTDKAGNIHTAAIKKDTIVEYVFTYEGTERLVENGAVINRGKVKFSPVNGDSAEIKIIVLNGETYTGNATTTFAEDGKWEILIEDKMHNSSYFVFYIITHSLSTFDYTTPYTYKITDLIYDSGDGIEISYLGNVIQNDYTSRMKFVESGKYYVTAKSNASATVLTFELTIDRVPPKVELVGAEDGGFTTSNVTLSGCQVNDVIKVYKNGELIQTINVTTSSTKMPEIREEGEYKIEVINLAGNVTTLTFTRRYTANAATTIAIFAALILGSTAIFIGLIYRKRMKV